ncbi:MAG: hypothetical protein KJ893_08065 [Candidatus Omnitrophica bacterium]|nr:hypothetical protein [Candidatus Omnitrophota bacterium]MBU4477925.1 hypothetical protein [Candidatus Omnitrophota bacterium]MCG2703847.1 hypothetical protein [Candidatus Omnitrophota bacterium]
MSGFFTFFIAILLIAIAVFVLLYTGHEYECCLPNGGYYKIRWDEKKRKIEQFYWQPKSKVKPLPKNTIRLQNTEKK